MNAKIIFIIIFVLIIVTGVMFFVFQQSASEPNNNTGNANIENQNNSISNMSTPAVNVNISLGNQNANASTNINEMPQNTNIASANTNAAVDTTNWKSYVESNEYSIRYPSHWELKGGGKNLGSEILTLWKYDPDPIIKDHGGQDPNSAKIALSIQLTKSKTLEQIVNESYQGTENGYQKEKFIVNGQNAIRIYSLESREMLGVRSPRIHIFIEYKDDECASLIGWYGEGSDKDLIIKDIKQIQESFEIIKQK